MFKTVILTGLLALALAGFLFAGYSTTANAPGWLRMVGIEIQAACRDAGTQWMVVICLLSYLIVFILLERRIWPQESTKFAKQTAVRPTSDFRPPTSIFARLVPFCGKNSDAWLVVFVAIVLLRYAFDYTNAARSLQVVVLLTGIVVGKGIGLWVGSLRSEGSRLKSGESSGEGGVRSAESQSTIHSQLSTNSQPSTINRAQLVLCVLTLLLACAALWQPERGMEFQYRGQRRWSGVWDNPNTYGVLMGVGTVLAVGLLLFGKRPTSNVQRSTSNEVRRGESVGDEVTSRSPEALLTSCPTNNYQQSTLNYLLRALYLCAAALCAYGLLKSYSRGAWLGTAVGIGYLMWRFMECGGMTPLWWTRHVASGESCAKSQQSKSWLLPSSILLFSILIISFWQFRHTESPLVRRVFSVGNPNDFSWRNRVTAWQGAGRMMWDKPLAGFGWGKAEEIYSKEYRAARLEESAAVQLNDYLMIGISAGVPALVCFVAYLCICCRRPSGIRHLTPALSPFEAERESGLSTIHHQLSTICASGAAVLLIGFWFDGGLFKLPTCVVFWVLLELSRREFLTTMPAGGESVLASQLVSSLAPPMQDGAQRTARPTIVLRCMAAIFAIAAIGLTALHLGTPQLAVSERRLNIARKYLVPSKEQTDFDYLAAKPIWSNTPLKTLLQHAHLANYNRTLVNWKLDDDLYREFVLSPEFSFPVPTLSSINSPLSTDLNWRRPLWEYFYPRIRKESSLEAATEIIVRNLNEVCRRQGGLNSKLEMGRTISEIWRQQTASDDEFERICVAALRSAGIPARLSKTRQAEFWNGAEWKLTSKPAQTT